MYTWRAHVGAVESMDFDRHTLRLATAGEGMLKVWKFQANCMPNIGRDVYLLRDWIDSTLLHAESKKSDYIVRDTIFFSQGSCVLATYLQSHEV